MKDYRNRKHNPNIKKTNAKVRRRLMRIMGLLLCIVCSGFLVFDISSAINTDILYQDLQQYGPETLAAQDIPATIADDREETGDTAKGQPDKTEKNNRQTYVLPVRDLGVPEKGNIAEDRPDKTEKNNRQAYVLSVKDLTVLGKGETAEEQPDKTEKNDRRIYTLSDKDLAVPEDKVDFDALRKTNPDIKAWITIEQADEQTPLLSYPVVQGVDNDYYLHHAIDQTESKSGSIMMNCENAAPFVGDRNTILFGHNMRDGTMFGCLKNIDDRIGDIVIYVPGGQEFRYHVFCIAKVSTSSPIYNISFTEPLFADCLKELQNNQLYWEDVRDNTSFVSLLTLSTCSGAQRLVVAAYQEDRG